MTEQAERLAIETYFQSNFSRTSRIGYDEQKFEPVADSIRLSIINGIVTQGSIGMVSNRIDNHGLIEFEIYTLGGIGSQSWRGHTEAIKTLFRGKTIDDAGVLITTPDDAFIRFSPNNQHPYVSGSQSKIDAPLKITIVNVPFVRYEFH